VGVRAAAAAIALTLLVCVVAIGGSEPLRGTSAGSGEAQEPREVRVPVERARVVQADEDSGIPSWLLLAAAAVALAGLVAAGVLLVRIVRSWQGLRRPPPTPLDPEPDEDEGAAAVSEADEPDVARRAVEAALAPLRDPTDPRAAVIEAYARMETVLAERELGRDAPEAPREYLARVLREHGMPELSLTTLTDMFEEARFSHHPIPDSAPRRAFGELQNARAALAARDG
jgi:Domain of unknown function (DUF4129)